MKEFDKWWNEYLEEHVQYCIDNYNTVDKELPKKMLMPYKHFHSESWQAALEWSLTKDTDLNATELADAIRKELQDGSS